MESILWGVETKTIGGVEGICLLVVSSRFFIGELQRKLVEFDMSGLSVCW